MGKTVVNKETKRAFEPEKLFAAAIGLLLVVAAFVLAKKLFGGEYGVFVKWWFTILALGIIFLPLSVKVFDGFKDLGWMFSKTLGIALSGWLTWYLSSMHILKFTRTGCITAVGICLVLNIVLLVYDVRKKRGNYGSIDLSNISHILLAEGVFLVLFVFWLYLKGFNPYAYGTTEKLMDYGFMVALDKSEYMPCEDIWLSGYPLNYYYVGQFFATYLSKLSGCGVEYGYNLMLMLIAALAFSLPASIICNVAYDRLKDSGREDHPVYRLFPLFCAGLSGVAVSLAGNMQYVIYAKIVPAVRSILGLDKMAEEVGYSFPNYWFPTATRYIGYYPETNDKTIHEFPVYSFVLGDLHAHVINIIFVLSVVGILYAYLRSRKMRMDEARLKGISAAEGENTLFGIPSFFREIFDPRILLTGFFIGLFHTTNFWDFPIYFVVAGAVILFSNAVLYDFSMRTLKLTFFHAVVIIVVQALVCLPFTISFNQISSSIRLCENRTPLYQLMVLWGLPLIVVFYFLFMLITEQKEKGVYSAESGSHVGRRNPLYRFIGNLEVPELFVLTIGLCAAGLILLPEIIYVKDIYSGSYKRANTMFKLTYQAFILFGMTMGYVIPRQLFFPKKTRQFVYGVIAGMLLIATAGYFDNSTNAWFGDWKNGDGYKELRCDEYLKTVNINDYKATNWINENIEGRPVILEINGPSYRDYSRVSIRTGLPTLLGWLTHEQLWQWDGVNDMAPVITEREADIKTIYTSSDEDEVKRLVDRYNIEYIYIGGLERTDLKEELNEELLKSLGSIVFTTDPANEDPAAATYIIKID